MIFISLLDLPIAQNGLTFYNLLLLVRAIEDYKVNAKSLIIVFMVGRIGGRGAVVKRVG